MSQNIPVYPGIDSKSHTNSLHQKVAGSVAQINPSIPVTSVVPPASSILTSEEASNVMEKPGAELDFEDIIAGEKGKTRTEPSNNFLSVFLNRLRKKNPQGEVKKI